MLAKMFLTRGFMAKNRGLWKLFNITRNLLKTIFAITRVHSIHLLDTDIDIKAIDTWVKKFDPTSLPGKRNFGLEQTHLRFLGVERLYGDTKLCKSDVHSMLWSFFPSYEVLIKFELMKVFKKFV